MAHYQELGFVPWQVIVGAVQGTALGASSLTQKAAQDKYLKTQTHTLQKTHQDAVSLKKADLSHREQLLVNTLELEDIKAEKIRKLSAIAFISIMGLGSLGLFIYYIFVRKHVSS